MKFQTTHLDANKVEVYSLLHLADCFSFHSLTCGVAEGQSDFLFYDVSGFLDRPSV